MTKHKFRYGEDWYTICVTQDDWWIEESIFDMPEGMLRAGNEFALENGMAMPAEMCPTCRKANMILEKGNYSLQSVARLGGRSLVVPDIERRRCPECDEMVFPGASCDKIDQAVQRAVDALFETAIKTQQERNTHASQNKTD